LKFSLILVLFTRPYSRIHDTAGTSRVGDDAALPLSCNRKGQSETSIHGTMIRVKIHWHNNSVLVRIPKIHWHDRLAMLLGESDAMHPEA